MASLAPSFSPMALSTSNQQRNTKKNISKKKNSNFTYKPKPKPQPDSLRSDDSSSSSSSTSSISVEATTYTRLPPKEDFLASSLLHTVKEIKLVESTPETKNKEKKWEKEKQQPENNGFHYEEEEEEQEQEWEEEEEEEWDQDFDEDVEMVVLEGQELEELKAKEKGVPAVMRCFDRAKIYVKAGNGGSGVVAFRREKFVPLGGPSGGDGGRGGNVYVEVDGERNSLLPFRNRLHFRAGRGGHGQGRNQHGAKGEDVVVKVPPGTVIREDGGEGEVLLELLHPGQRALLLPGGRGGRGNAAFKTGINKVPKIAEKGEEGMEM